MHNHCQIQRLSRKHVIIHGNVANMWRHAKTPVFKFELSKEIDDIVYMNFEFLHALN